MGKHLLHKYEDITQILRTYVKARHSSTLSAVWRDDCVHTGKRNLGNPEGQLVMTPAWKCREQWLRLSCDFHAYHPHVHQPSQDYTCEVKAHNSPVLQDLLDLDQDSATQTHLTKDYLLHLKHLPIVKVNPKGEQNSRTKGKASDACSSTPVGITITQKVYQCRHCGPLQTSDLTVLSGV